MIKQDKSHTEISGSTNLLINECAQLTLAIAATIPESTSLTSQEVLDAIQQSITINTLVEAGMTIKEALEIGDPGKHIIKITNGLEEFAKMENG